MSADILLVNLDANGWALSGGKLVMRSCYTFVYIGHVTFNPVYGVCDQVRPNPATETSKIIEKSL